MNKKGFISFILVTVLLWSVGVQPVLAQISDVPRDHWAYHAVVTLVNKGYLAVYEDGTFQGSRPVDRYTLAVTVARILDDIEAGRVQGTVDDLALIEELTTELRTELVAWYAERAALEDKLASAEQLLVVTDDRLNRVVASHTELQAEVAAIKAEILEQLRQEAVQLELTTAEQATTIGEQQSVIARQGELINQQAEAITGHELRLNELDAQLKEQQFRLDELVGACGSGGDNPGTRWGYRSPAELGGGEECCSCSPAAARQAVEGRNRYHYSASRRVEPIHREPLQRAGQQHCCC